MSPHTSRGEELSFFRWGAQSRGATRKGDTICSVLLRYISAAKTRGGLEGERIEGGNCFSQFLFHRGRSVDTLLALAAGACEILLETGGGRGYMRGVRSARSGRGCVIWWCGSSAPAVIPPCLFLSAFLCVSRSPIPSRKEPRHDLFRGAVSTGLGSLGVCSVRSRSVFPSITPRDLLVSELGPQDGRYETTRTRGGGGGERAGLLTPTECAS
ncbi:hypothetical protein LZ30DRAFT_724539 [Colletotrichum cereale]|nr:hypothetical protein LZ30DRAFT_724539 [Colletotrichum cereale]